MIARDQDGPGVPGTPARAIGNPMRGPVEVGLRQMFVETGAKTLPVSESLLMIGWHGRWIILLCIVAALGAGIAYIETSTPIYQSSSKLYLDYGGIPVPQASEPGRMPRTERYLYTQAELLLSRPILGAVLEAPEIRAMKTFENVDIPLAYLRKRVRADVGKKDEIITVSFESPYALEAAQIVNAIAEAYLRFRSEHEQRSSAQVLKIVQEERTLAREELDAKRNELADFQANGMPLSLGSSQGGGVMQDYMTLQSACRQARTETMEAESFLSGVEALAADPTALRQYVAAAGYVSAYVGTAAEKTSLEEHRSNAQMQLQGLSEELMPGHARIQALEDEVKRVDARLQELDDQLVSATLAAARQRYLDTKTYEEDLIRQYEQQGEKVVKLNAELFTHDRLRSEVLQLAEFCKTDEQQFREIRGIVGEDVGQFKMERLESAHAAEEPSSPRKARIMAAALIGGILMGGTLTVLRDSLNQTFRSAEEISSYLGLAVLGVVPRMSRRQKVEERGQVVRLRPDSPEAEAFRTIRTAVIFGAAKERAKTILITSPNAGDGKSTLASNFAMAMAQAGQKTIVVDADFRKPMQGIIFGFDHGHEGLSAVLAGEMELGKAIRSTEVGNLSVLPCGANVRNPAEILNSHHFTELVGRLAESYDRVVIDAPPVTVVADAQILGAVSDVSVLVLRAEKSTRKVSKRAIDALESVGAHLLGAMVNDVRQAGDRYGYYGGYHGSNHSARKATGTGARGVEREVDVTRVSKGGGSNGRD